MARVLGVGGVFLRAADPDALRAWYVRVLGFELEAWGGAKFPPLPRGATVWAPFAAGTEYFAPSSLDVMLNFVVDDLDGVVARVEAEGVTTERGPEDENGRFAYVMDPEGRKLELWEPAPAAG